MVFTAKYKQNDKSKFYLVLTNPNQPKTFRLYETGCTSNILTFSYANEMFIKTS